MLDILPSSCVRPRNELLIEWLKGALKGARLTGSLFREEEIGYDDLCFPA